MDPLERHAIPLSQSADIDEKKIGGKAAKLAQLARAGFRIPDGFSIPVGAYREFITATELDKVIQFELGRKSFDTLRWEEIWDAALRIRTAFQTAEIPTQVQKDILKCWKQLGAQKSLAVRSSAPKEDSAQASFAGLHESYVGVRGRAELLDAVRLVWASLWSDAALLYQHELGLDPLHSAMAVVVQELVEENVSGVAFGVDPRNPASNHSIIEAVPGLCQDLVDGILDPDRWLLARSDGRVIEVRPGNRETKESQKLLLDDKNVRQVYSLLQDVEQLFGWYPDTEWTGRAERLTLLQARPITTSEPQPRDQKAYYLTLRPGQKRLRKLAERVSGELIPQLEAEGEKLAAEVVTTLSDNELAKTIETRQNSFENWKQIYWDEFIPFAHGVRHLATYYNDAVHPEDPYEFVGLLRGQSMISTQRNQALMDLALQLRQHTGLLKRLNRLMQDTAETSVPFSTLEAKLEEHPDAKSFFQEFHKLLDRYMDVSYGQDRMKDQPLAVLRNLLEMAKTDSIQERESKDRADVRNLENKFFRSVGPDRETEAREILKIGRLSWRLRDDDNLLLGRVESQLLRAIEEGLDRLESAGRLESSVRPNPKLAPIVAAALRYPAGGRVEFPAEEAKTASPISRRTDIQERQLIGQPAAPGLVSGKVRLIRNATDLGKFQAGEVLVCDAIQPNMTHLVPLAGAIIERRGGMLIHGAIIAREMGIPCVNGVPNAADLLENGELVTVDGHLGIVTVGAAEFDLEIGD